MDQQITSKIKKNTSIANTRNITILCRSWNIDGGKLGQAASDFKRRLGLCVTEKIQLDK